MAVTDLRAEPLNQFLLIGLSECNEKYVPISRQCFAMIDQSLSFSTASNRKS